MDEKRKFLEELPVKVGKLDAVMSEIGKEVAKYQ